MAKYTDELDRTWSIVIDGGVMLRLKREENFNICKLLEGGDDSLSSLLQDFERLINCLWLCVEEQAIAKKVDEISFAKGLIGDSLASAIKAFIDAVIFFFPEEGQRTTIQKIMMTSETIGKAILRTTNAELDKLESGISSGSLSCADL